MVFTYGDSTKMAISQARFKKRHERYIPEHFEEEPIKERAIKNKMQKLEVRLSPLSLGKIR